jgi:hypothetical protein
MQAESEKGETGEKGVPIMALVLSHKERDSGTSIEAALEDPETKRLTRKLLRKLDTR